jgi:hypothetical protein
MVEGGKDGKEEKEEEGGITNRDLKQKFTRQKEKYNVVARKNNSIYTRKQKAKYKHICDPGCVPGFLLFLPAWTMWTDKWANAGPTGPSIGCVFCVACVGQCVNINWSLTHKQTHSGPSSPSITSFTHTFTTLTSLMHTDTHSS